MLIFSWCARIVAGPDWVDYDDEDDAYDTYSASPKRELVEISSVPGVGVSSVSPGGYGYYGDRRNSPSPYGMSPSPRAGSPSPNPTPPAAVSAQLAPGVPVAVMHCITNNTVFSAHTNMHVGCYSELLHQCNSTGSQV